ncbi:MAG TPA: hypothetical protein VLH59_00540 [Ignavibacteriaceae bacterium]|nr:hypothetical protein [Ignavibacteriaceae bacterium]
MRRAIISVLAISLGILIKSCDTTDPPDNKSLALKLEDVSCTEAWIKLETTNLQLPVAITIKQTNPTGDTKSQVVNLNTKDSLLYIDSLLPNKNYKYLVSSNENQVSSNELSVTTMDTTTHNFTFESWTFGTIGSSTLYDVAIINENNIWAVGEILVADTSINGYTTYNAVHWDGSQWELKRILYQGGFWVIRTIFAFSENDIWFSAFVRYDGQNLIELPIPPILIGWSINKIWGSSSSDLYAVGNGGNIAFYNGSKWTKIVSGTDLNINDIWGGYNEKTNEWEILAVASNVNTSTDRTLIKINNITSQIISSSPIQWSLRTVWFMPSRQYFVAGSGIYEKHNLKENEWLNNPLDITTFYTNRIRGNEINDVVGIGAFGDFVHFNGTGWKVNYQDSKLNYGSYLSLDIKENIVAAVGLEYNQAVILIASKINQ